LWKGAYDHFAAGAKRPVRYLYSCMALASELVQRDQPTNQRTPGICDAGFDSSIPGCGRPVLTGYCILAREHNGNMDVGVALWWKSYLSWRKIG